MDSGYLLVADTRTFSDLDRPILVLNIDPADEGSSQSNSIRVTPDYLASVENNLAIANSHFADFADAVDAVDAVDADGVYRGGPSQPDTRTLTIEELPAAPGSELPGPIVAVFIGGLQGARKQERTTARYVATCRRPRSIS